MCYYILKTEHKSELLAQFGKKMERKVNIYINSPWLESDPPTSVCPHQLLSASSKSAFINLYFFI